MTTTSASCPAFAGPYGVARSIVSKLVVTPMIRPQPCSRSRGAAALAMKNCPLKFVAIVLVQFSTGSSQKRGPLGLRGLMPALFTRMCTAPSSAIVLRTVISASAGFVTSPAIGSTQSFPPTIRASSAVCSRACASMSIIATRAPARTSAMVIACPSPMRLPAPVTIATLP